jgi:hypothetical protein
MRATKPNKKSFPSVTKKEPTWGNYYTQASAREQARSHQREATREPMSQEPNKYRKHQEPNHILTLVLGIQILDHQTSPFSAFNIRSGFRNSNFGLPLPREYTLSIKCQVTRVAPTQGVKDKTHGSSVVHNASRREPTMGKKPYTITNTSQRLCQCPRTNTKCAKQDLRQPRNQASKVRHYYLHAPVTLFHC